MEFWSYHGKKFRDKKGRRWHFMSHYGLLESRRQLELYFRDDDRTVFGVMRFGPGDSFPGLPTVTRKIMYDAAYRAEHLDDDSMKVWRGRGRR